LEDEVSPDFVGGARLGLAQVADLDRKLRGLRELEHDVVRDAGQDQVGFRRSLDHATAHDEHVARRGFGQHAVAEQNRLGRAGVRRELPQQHVADQRDRLDVAAMPAVVLRAHRFGAALDGLARRIHQGVRHDEYRRRGVLRKRMVALSDSAGHLEVHALIFIGLLRDELRDDVAPLRARVRIADPRLGKAAFQPREMLFQANGTRE
jgi:hypothetical protein